MSTAKQLVPVAALLGLSSASFLTAYITAFTIVAVPAIEVASDMPSQARAKQWQKAYHLGKAAAPPVAITAAGCFAFLAYQTRSLAGSLAISPSALYAIAAVLAPSIVPFTLLVMGPSTLTPLEAKADGKANAPSDGETRELVKKWAGQNLVRAAITGLSATLSAVAIYAQIE